MDSQAGNEIHHKHKFYEDLITHTKHANPLIIGGDFNVRLNIKPSGFGNYFLQMPNSFKQPEFTRINQDFFASFLTAMDFFATNTNF